MLMNVASFFSRAMIKTIGFGWKEEICEAAEKYETSGCQLLIWLGLKCV